MNQPSHTDPRWQSQPLITRADGLCFERCYHPSLLRCATCLALVAPEGIKEHSCHQEASHDHA
jgi:hypothetical protein